MQAFEIHTFHDGRWKIDSILDDRELAVLEARCIKEGRLKLGLRVVEEEFDVQSRPTMLRAIFHSSSSGECAKTRCQQREQSGMDRHDVQARNQTATEPDAEIPSIGRVLSKFTLAATVILAAIFGIRA